MSQRYTTVPVKLDPWAAADRCQRDAKAFVESAIAKARADGHTKLTGAIEAMTVLYGNLMASNARLSAEMESLRRRVGNENFVQRWLRKGNA